LKIQLTRVIQFTKVCKLLIIYFGDAKFEKRLTCGKKALREGIPFKARVTHANWNMVSDSANSIHTTQTRARILALPGNASLVRGTV
jgi:hypothetical protein